MSRSSLLQRCGRLDAHTGGDADRRIQDEPIARFQTGAHINRGAVIGGNIEMPDLRHAVLFNRGLQPVLVEDDSL